MSSINQSQNNSHILGSCSSIQRKIEEGLEYLRIGFEENNEAVLMITDELTNWRRNNKKMKILSKKVLEELERNNIIYIIHYKYSSEVNLYL